MNFSVRILNRFENFSSTTSLLSDVENLGQSGDIITVYFEAKAKLLPIKMYLSTILTPWFIFKDH